MGEPEGIVQPRPPRYGSISNWLGAEAVAQLLDFVQTSRDRFKAADVGYGEHNRTDLSYRRSSKLKALGELESELEARARAALPTMCEQLDCSPLEPDRFELEMVAHGDKAFFTCYSACNF